MKNYLLNINYNYLKSRLKQWKKVNIYEECNSTNYNLRLYSTKHFNFEVFLK